MFTLRDFEVSQQIHQDALQRAAHERMLREIVPRQRGRYVPFYAQGLSFLGQSLINMGEFLMSNAITATGQSGHKPKLCSDEPLRLVS